MSNVDQQQGTDEVEVLDALPVGFTVTSSAVVPLAYDEAEVALETLRKSLGGAEFDMAGDGALKEARSTVKKLVQLRTATKELYDKWNAPILESQKAARTRRDYILEEVKKIEDPIADQVEAEAKRLEDIKNRKRLAEVARIEGHTAALTQLQKLPDRFVSAKSTDITAQLQDLNSFEFLTGRNWEEFLPSAQDAVRSGIDKLTIHLTNADARENLARFEAEHKRQADERAEADRAAATERERVAALKERIQTIANLPTTCIGLPSSHIQHTLKRLEKTDGSDFAELQTEALDAIASTRSNLQIMLDAATAAELAAEESARDKRELEEFRTAKTRAAREKVDREASEARAETERAAAEKKVADERVAAAAQAERDAEAERQRAAEVERQAAEATAKADKAAADAARQRVEKIAEYLLDLLKQSRPHLQQSGQTSLVDAIDAAVALAQGE